MDAFNVEDLVLSALKKHPDFSEPLIRLLIEKSSERPFDPVTQKDATLFADAVAGRMELAVASIEGAFELEKQKGVPAVFNIFGSMVEHIDGIFYIID